MTGRKRTERIDIMERLVHRHGFLVVASVLAFGVLFTGSNAVVSVPLEESVGSMILSGDLARVIGQTEPEVLPADESLFYTVYEIAKGDSISGISDRFNITQDAVITFNNIRYSRSIQVGQLLKIPNMNGILVRVRKGETVKSLAEAYAIPPDRIVEVNRLPVGTLEEGKPIFLPDARLPSFALKEINGDLFLWPVRGYLTSYCGWRRDPFSGTRTYHNGLDIGASIGASVAAAMEGVVSATGYSTTFGNYVVIAHHSGYSSMYGHLSRIGVSAGRRVAAGTIIGAVGNTGYSTGSHLHFTVMKNGRVLNPLPLLK